MTKETQLKGQVKDYLRLKGIFNFPVLQGLGAEKGVPDRIAVKDGKFIALEIKAPKGVMSEYQLNFKQRLELAGGIYLEVRKLEDVIEYFK